MTAQEIRDGLKNIFGKVVTVYAESDSILYVPSDVIKKLEKANMLKSMGLDNEVVEDKMFNSLRHINRGQALRAFRI